jgi:2-C-methyl-D-erythritol 4-phosphate cytidylyltransferase
VAVSVWTIVVAAGSGTRYGGLKQFENLGSRRVVDWGIETARRASDGVVVVLPVDVAPLEIEGVLSVAGGATRSASVRNGLEAVPEDATVILVHDGCRPFASLDLFDRVIHAVRAGADGAIPGVPVTDTIKRVDVDGTVIGTVDRSDLRAAQTPQGFRSGAIRDAYIGGNDATDDAAVVEESGGRVVVVEGDSENRKLTTPADLVWARQKVASA